jgi:asparagine synthetase B (glutamine-hydrolysing)
MCGILLVKSKDSIPLSKHLSAFRKLESRGPDFSRYQHRNNIFIGQSVLHITGDVDYYNQQHTNFLAYNGEIYNYQELGSYQNDVEFVHDCIKNDITKLTAGWGPWAFTWTDGTTTLYATDPQGEKTLYQYQDDSILIVASEVTAILEYINNEKIHVAYPNKTWTMSGTPWKGITKLAPGQLYQNGQARQELDSIWSWIGKPQHTDIDEAYEDFTATWQYVVKHMTPACPAALTYSGGLDSSLILNSIPGLELYAINNIGKDPIVDVIKEFLNKDELTRLHMLTVDEEQWAREFQNLVQCTRMPASSWSYVGQWIATKHCQERVLFTGCGADELFGGYDIYKELSYSLEASTSPYSEFHDADLWNRCLSVYNGDARQATLLIDYWHQVVWCDSPAVDMIAGAWGIEARNPFMSRPIMQLALNLPWDFKVSTISKPIIRRAFLERWSDALIFPKKGFTGHANDSLPYMPFTIDSTGDRLLDWKQIACKSFYDSNC